jgi:hypothetical protein
MPVTAFDFDWERIRKPGDRTMPRIMMPRIMFAAAWLAAWLLLPAVAEAGGCCSKPPPANGPGVQAGHGAASVRNQNNTPAAQHFADVYSRRIPGSYETGSEGSDKILGMTVNFSRDVAVINNIDLLMHNSPVAALRDKARNELLAVGISVLPTEAEFQALRTYNMNPGDAAAGAIAFRYLGDVAAFTAWANEGIKERAGDRIYDRVDPALMAADAAAIDHQNAGR